MTYQSFLSTALKAFLLKEAKPLHGIEGLQSIGESGGLESVDSLNFLIELYKQIKPELVRVLNQRIEDRKFIDERCRALSEYNSEFGISVTDEDYKTVLGLEDKDGRIVVGPLNPNYWKTENQKPVASIPEYLKGAHVTLFGPPDSAKMCINAMNAYHRELKGEPSIVKELLATHQSLPKWGADDEDSKTPMRADLISAGENLSRCFDGELSVTDPDSQKKYQLQKNKLALPIKRFPGLALPCTFLYFDNQPIPLHLYDFALHLFKNWQRPEALVFYVPKLENEEEARYIKNMIVAAESLIKKQNPSYQIGTVRLMIVLENPRAVFRTHEIMDELYPYFAGASLGWHDYLASAARLFREDSNYRIPTKADPDIVIKYIKASHDLLANVVGPRGGIKVGGMYGILPIDSDLRSESFQLTLKGYFRDVFTQMKRDLTGFWVAHPDFVRLGLAMVESWKFHINGDSSKVESLVRALLDPKYHDEVLNFVFGKDVASLDPKSSRYARALIVSDLKQSELVANSDPESIRYNVFQSLQYLADWLSGNGCVALPGQINGIPVRIMDDLATAERSRWEVWHEVRNGRISIEKFLKIAFEEFHFIQKDLSNSKKIIQVKWNEQNAKWYPLALKLMIKLMTDREPAEFATELLLPLTMDSIRQSEDPWATLQSIDPHKYSIRQDVRNFMDHFECCGHLNWASKMAADHFCDLEESARIILGFSKQDIIEAASFHGNIGEARKTLDSKAAQEQAQVLDDSEKVRLELLEVGAAYQKKFGMKFLISAKGKNADEILEQLKLRILNPLSTELQNARQALTEITEKRLMNTKSHRLRTQLIKIQKKYRVEGASLAVSSGMDSIATLAMGQNRSGEALKPDVHFQIASLSKSISATFAVDFFAREEIELSRSVNELFESTSSNFRLKSADGKPEAWANEVTIEHLLRHEALNLHYVNGAPGIEKLPEIHELLNGHEELDYQPIRVISKPGTEFHYSGAGYLVLEHLVEALSNRSILDLTRPYLAKLGLHEISFSQYNQPHIRNADAITGNSDTLIGGRKHFPSFAAGAMGTARAVQSFVMELGAAYRDNKVSQSINHDAAVRILNSVERGSWEFMRARMGLGVFVTDAGPNKLILHQGANDGYRCLFLHCFDGPDRGKGMTLLCNGELNAIQFIAEATQLLLKHLEFTGIDFTKFAATFNASKLKAEEVVNRGYKELIFSAFEENLPEPIPRRSAVDPLSPHNKILGAKILACTNQKFALAANLLSPYLPVFEVDLYGEQGKVMDSWESARHSDHESEDLILELSAPTKIQYVYISTQYHNGNQVPLLSLEGRNRTEDPWTEVLAKTEIAGHAFKKIKLAKVSGSLSQLKIRTYPDGGLTRLGIYDESLPSEIASQFQSPSEVSSTEFSDLIPQPKKPLSLPFQATPDSIKNCWKRLESSSKINYASAALGATIVSVSNQHYSPASQVISPFKPLNMFDGFESSRSRKAGHFEECVIKLARAVRIQEIELDFSFYRNNNPRAVAIEYLKKGQWKTLVEKTNVKAFAGNHKTFFVSSDDLISELRFVVHPDGGINRIRVY